MSGLLAHHQQLISDSAITEEVAAERGYWSATKPAELVRWFGATQRKLVPALVIPIYDVRGDLALMQLRPDEPRVVDGRIRKYELPARCRVVLDVPPRVRPMLGDPSIPLLVTEGSRKCDAAVSAGLCAISIPGVTTWRGKNDNGGKVALPDHELIAFNGRVVFLAFDSDAMQKVAVFDALRRYRAFLERLDAEVRVINLPAAEHGTKTGLDDFLAAGHDATDVLSLASDELREPGMPRRNPKPAPDVKLRATAELVHEVGTVVDRYVVLPSRAAALTISSVGAAYLGVRGGARHAVFGAAKRGQALRKEPRRGGARSARAATLADRGGERGRHVSQDRGRATDADLGRSGCNLRPQRREQRGAPWHLERRKPTWRVGRARGRRGRVDDSRRVQRVLPESACRHPRPRGGRTRCSTARS